MCVYIYIYIHTHTHTYIYPSYIYKTWIYIYMCVYIYIHTHICIHIHISKFDFWVGKITWKKQWLPIPVFLIGEFQGQRSWWATVPGITELDTIEQLTLKVLCDGLFSFSLLTVFSSASEFLSAFFFLRFLSLCSTSHLVHVLFS